MSNRNTTLYRPDEGRWIAGVAAGLSLRFGLPVWLIRTAFAALCLVGGLGIPLYAAGWLLIPRQGETESVAQGWVGAGQARRWIGVILVGVAVIILAAQVDLIRVDLVFAVVLIGIGVMLFRGDLSRPGSRLPTPPAPTGEDPPETAPEAASAVVVPEPVATPAPRKERSYLGRVCVGVAAIALGVLGLLDEVVPGFHPEFHHYVALAVGVIGLGVVVGAWFGRPAGLVVLGVLLIPILIVSRLVSDGGVNLLSIEFTSVGDVDYRPASVEEVREEYELEVGGMTIDLRDVDFEGQTVTVDAEVGIGEILVRIPDDVAAEVRGHVGMGNLQVGDWERSGVGVEADLHLEGSAGTLVLDAEVGVGEMKVRTSPVDDRTPHRIPEEEAPREEYRIRDGSDLLAEYTLTTGMLRLDLEDLDLEQDRSSSITVDSGEVWVAVPDDVSLNITTRVERGRLTVFDDVWEGFNLQSTYSTPISGAPLLTLDIRLGVGSVTVEEER